MEFKGRVVKGHFICQSHEYGHSILIPFSIWRTHSAYIRWKTEIGAHIRRNLCSLICLRQLIRKRAVTNQIFFLRKFWLLDGCCQDSDSLSCDNWIWKIVLRIVIMKITIRIRIQHLKNHDQVSTNQI